MTNKIYTNEQLYYNIISGNAQLNILKKISELRKQVWPDFIRVSDDIIFKIYELYPDFQISLLDNNNELIGIANSIPLIWSKSLFELSNDGVGWVINTGVNEQYDIDLTNVLCAISITVAENHRNKGISKILLQHLKNISSNKFFSSLIVPVRPSLKSLYPLIPIDKYIEWKNKDGLAFDPWMRIHIALGARILNICHRSAIITGSIEQWEQWTRMNFPGDGEYVIKDALAPVDIEYANNLGTYVEPNVWVYYPIKNTLL